jgi:predicted O-linked N-acetylglucosamine transferase (SPINDLY family)
MECSLPDDEFIFCCFNASYKINPIVFDSWMRILQSTGNSVLWLSEQNDFVISNLRKEAEKKGINPNRLIYATRTDLVEDHLARQSLADLFLDTLPYNAHTTVLDALWAGLPVLTCIGESFAGRVAASALNAIELPELITTTRAQYEASAIEFANNPTKLKVIKEKLKRKRLNTALFDSVRFTRNFEKACVQVHEWHHAKLAADNIHIQN